MQTAELPALAPAQQTYRDALERGVPSEIRRAESELLAWARAGLAMEASAAELEAFDHGLLNGWRRVLIDAAMEPLLTD